MSRANLCKVKISRGSLLGRSVSFTEHENLRPTPSRVREAVFSMLADYAEEEYGFIDACAGSGVMGFTAVSCEFAPVIMVENNRDALAELETNKRRLDVSAEIILGSAVQVRKLPMSAGPWICYADPPFTDRKFHGKLMKRLAEHAPFAIGSLYVAEHEVPLEPLPGFVLLKDKKYGRTLISVFEKDSQVEAIVAESEAE